jgi:hypothetical protein
VHGGGSESGRAYPYIICTRRELKNGIVAGCVGSDDMFIGSDWVFNVYDGAGHRHALHISYHSRNSTRGLSLSSNAEACWADEGSGGGSAVPDVGDACLSYIARSAHRSLHVVSATISHTSACKSKRNVPGIAGERGCGCSFVGSGAFPKSAVSTKRLPVFESYSMVLARAGHLGHPHLRKLLFRGIVTIPVTMRWLALCPQAALFIDSRLFIPMLHIFLLRTL